MGKIISFWALKKPEDSENWEKLKKQKKNNETKVIKQETFDVLWLLEQFDNTIKLNKKSLNKYIYENHQIEFQDEDKYTKIELMQMLITELSLWDNTRLNYCYWLYLELKRRIAVEKKPTFKIIK